MKSSSNFLKKVEKFIKFGTTNVGILSVSTTFLKCFLKDISL